MRGIILATAVVLAVPFQAESGVLFFDDFNGTAIDLAKWGNIHNQGTMEVSGGTLKTYGGGDHHHMTSNTLFNLTEGLEVSARVRISNSSGSDGQSDDYHSLGLSHGDQAPTPSWEAFQISSYDDRDGENHNTVHWYASTNPGSAEYARGIVPLAWNEFNVLAIRRVAGGVSFRINGLEVGFAPTSYTGPLPVYIGGDRNGLFEVDWVQVVDNVPEPSTGTLAFAFLLLLITARRPLQRLRFQPAQED